ncbi:MAG: hypothetical protein ACXVCV_20765 [Polyangia bacterium]
MRTWGIVLLSLAGFGFALWLARGGDAPKPPTTIATAAPAAVAQPFPRFGVAAPAATTATGAEAKAAPTKLDVKSDRFRNRLDEQIPSRLYAEAARCYKGGLQRDQRMDLTYRIRVTDGNVTIGDIRVTESTLGDSSLERCIRDKIVAARWRDDELPDLEEDDDLFMRVAGFSSYLANLDDDPPSSAMN